MSIQSQKRYTIGIGGIYESQFCYAIARGHLQPAGACLPPCGPRRGRAGRRARAVCRASNGLGVGGRAGLYSAAGGLGGLGWYGCLGGMAGAAWRCFKRAWRAIVASLYTGGAGGLSVSCWPML